VTSPTDPDRWEELRSAFDQLVELDPTARRDRLTAIGKSDPTCAAVPRDDARRRCRRGGTPGQPGAGPGDGRAAAAHDPAMIGQTIGHFRILEPLASGGMGVVYRAEDTRLGRQVALKFPLPDHRLDGRVRERFLREARAGGALDHPNLCSIYTRRAKPRTATSSSPCRCMLARR
jgi:hypothetical protein